MMKKITFEKATFITSGIIMLITTVVGGLG